MAEAICLRCGFEKDAPWTICNRCSFDPTTDADNLVKSVYLSTGRFADEDRKTSYRAELNECAYVIENGGMIHFDKRDLHQLRRQRDMLATIPWFAPWLALIKLFFKPAVFIVSMLLLARFIRIMKGL